MALYRSTVGGGTKKAIDTFTLNSANANAEISFLLPISSDIKRLKIDSIVLANSNFDTSQWFCNSIHMLGGGASGTVLLNNITYPCDIDLTNLQQTAEQYGGSLRYGTAIKTTATYGNAVINNLELS